MIDARRKEAMHDDDDGKSPAAQTVALWWGAVPSFFDNRLHIALTICTLYAY
jgi:hypothetical protein